MQLSDAIIGNTTRHLSDESRWDIRFENIEITHALRHGCHELADPTITLTNTVIGFKCHHQKIKKDIPRLLRRLKWFYYRTQSLD